MNPPDAASTWIGTSMPVLACEPVERGGELLHRLVRAVVRDAEDRDDPDGVLVDRGEHAFGREVRLLLRDRHVARLDLEVVRELLPHHLHRRAEDDVRRLGRLARGARRASASGV